MSDDNSINVSIEANAAGVKAGMSQASESVTDAVGKMDTAFDKLVTLSQAAVNKMTAELNEKLSAASDQAAESITDSTGKMGTAFGNLADLSQAAINKMTESSESITNTVDKMGTAFGDLADSSQDVVNEMTASAESVTDAAGNMDEAFDDLSDSSQAVVKEMSVAAESVADSVGKMDMAFNDLAASTKTAVGQMTSSLNKNLSDASNKALQSITGVVSEMDTAFDNLSTSSQAAVNQVATSLSKKLPAASNQAVTAIKRVNVSVGAQRQGMLMLGYQINDVSTQLAMGTNPMMIFAQQGSQVVHAIQMMRGSATGLIGFLSSPWGAAILGAVSILGVLVTSHKRATSATKAHTEATKDLTQATTQLNEASQREITTTQASIQNNINQALALRKRALAARQAALAELELARASMQAAQQYLGSGMPSKGGAAVAAGDIATASANMETLNAEIARQNANIARTDQAIRANRGLQIQQQVAEATNASTAATGRYERQVYALTKALSSGRISENDYRKGIERATQARDAALAAARASKVSVRGGSTTGQIDRTSQWEDMLNAQRVAHEKMNQQNNTFFEFSQSQEATYWQTILQRQDLTSKERLEVEQKYLQSSSAVRQQEFAQQTQGLRNELDSFRSNQERRLEIATQIADLMKQKYGETSIQFRQAQTQVVAIERARADQIIQINSQIAESAQQAAFASVSAQADQAAVLEQLGVTSRVQALQQQIEFENQRYQINFQALQKQLHLMEQNPDMNPVEYQRIKNQILAIERQHNVRVNQMRSQQLIASQKTQLVFTNSIKQSWGETLSEMFVGMQTFRQGVASLWQGLVSAVVEALTQMIAKWISQKIAALILDKTLTTTSAIGKITANAAVAASGAYAATAAIPITGPALAPAAAATALAGAMAFAPMAAAGFAAESGFDIPSGMNPVTQLHQKEMVLPAQYAEVIRKMAEGNSSSGVPPINFYASPGMTQSEMERHAGTLVKILKNAHKNREFAL